ncbi:1,2-phenylacetyl-CoA epoxidase, subunit A [Roseobacter fucihabitans]|uniref:1,2-phenylacetyl-CoA epoxidase, subunit A n=1 Tax=Roseobacter fucihabitans TaxID=1537242 RepID=A0ABZ2BYD4_9RHOB|nr:Phenylacetic acid catabolic protein [Roseobacter litoralis]MBC6963752.1 1,2-phenylacetyl-CoA epoxidase, subunit A [Roseobacter litoralis]
MTDTMDISEYLAKGGRLTNPANVPTRYRAELMKIMATFVDSELAGAAGFADVINAGPGIKERIAAARIVLEKTDHADKVLRLMGEFGANTDRYANHHPWSDRLPRDTPPGTLRHAHDMRLSVLNYPLDGWCDAVVMNMLMGGAVGVQLSEFLSSSYQPFAEAIREIAPREQRHTELAVEGLKKLIQQGEIDAVSQSVAYWWPRVSDSFGSGATARNDALKAMGLRSRTNAQLHDRWVNITAATLEDLGVSRPAD